MEVAELDAEEQGLRDLGVQNDIQEDRPLPPDVSAQEKDSARAAIQAKPTESQPPAMGEPERQPANSEIDTRSTERPETQVQTEQKPPVKDPVTGKFVKQEQKPAGEADPRAQKEQERRDRSWQALQAEKESLRQQQAEWNERVRLSQLEQQRNAQPVMKDGLDVKGYYQGYQMFVKNAATALRDGDFETAAQQQANATRSLETVMELQQAEQQREAQRNQAQVEYAWRQQMEAVGTKNPDLFNPANPLAQRVEQLVRDNPWLYYVPHGFMRAVEVADMLSKMDSISELQEEVEELRAFKEKQLAKSQPTNGSAPAGRGGVKSIDDMTLDEGEAHLRRMTEQADAEARY